MARGRKAKPAAVKKAQGNPGRRPIPEEQSDAPDESGAEENEARRDAPALAPTAPPPAWLDSSDSVDGRSRKKKSRAAEIGALANEVWNELFPVVRQMNLVKESDLRAFGRYCRLFGEWVMFTRDIDRDGPTYESKSPHVDKLMRPNPAVGMRNRTEQQLRDLEDRLGLNPSARLSINQKLASRQPDLPGLGAGKAQPNETPQPTLPGGATGTPAGFLATRRLN